MSTRRDLLLLMRAPLAASAVSNLGVGLLLAHSSTWTTRTVVAAALLAPATCALYWAGMVLNDLFDLERDRTLYPKRPLPSGRVPLGLARGVGFGLLILGVALASVAGFLAGDALRGLAGGGAVALCILAYDAWLKRYRVVGSAAMGACRTSNALLAPVALGLWLPGAEVAPVVIYAAVLGFYVAALTVVSTFEDQDASPAGLGSAFGAALAAPLALAVVIVVSDGWGIAGLAGALALMAVVAHQAVLARREGTQARGGAMTRALLKGIWLLDLAVLLAIPQALEWQAALPLVVLVGLYMAGSSGAKALFRPPPATSAPSPVKMGPDGA